MTSRSLCICCHNPVLRHVNSTGIYWFCPSCRQTLPDGLVTTSAAETNASRSLSLMPSEMLTALVEFSAELPVALPEFSSSASLHPEELPAT